MLLLLLFFWVPIPQVYVFRMVSPRLTDSGLLRKAQTNPEGLDLGMGMLLELGFAEMVEGPREGISSHPSDSSLGQPPSDPQLA